MKLSKRGSKRTALWMAMGGFAVAGGCLFGPGGTSAMAQDPFVSDAVFLEEPGQGAGLQQVGCFGKSAGNACDEGCDAAPDCGCEVACGCEGPCDCEVACGCDASGCGCDGGEAGGLASGFQCDLGEPFALFGEVNGFSAGGWIQMGYHTESVPLFNNRPDELNLHQMWLYAEKSLDTSSGFDYGGRIDYVYGIDAQDTQAFGIDNEHWDNGWDNGEYGHAIPQLYGEIGYGDFSVKFGHFFTIIGWEVVAAPDNFFYSHAYTMYNSEPFTHTGALATVNASDDLTLYGGYTFGWDSGFEDNGDNFLGGASLALTDHITVTYATTGGRFNRSGAPDGTDERGYMHSIVSDVTLTDKLQYIGQSDILFSEGATGSTDRETYGYNNYLIYTLSDCVALGSRFEWYDSEGVFDNPVDIYAFTMGTNLKPHANVLIRPEVRWDFVQGDNTDGVLDGNETNQTTFGIDTIFLF